MIIIINLSVRMKRCREEVARGRSVSDLQLPIHCYR